MHSPTVLKLQSVGSLGSTCSGQPHSWLSNMCRGLEMTGIEVAFGVTILHWPFSAASLRTTKQKGWNRLAGLHGQSKQYGETAIQ